MRVLIVDNTIDPSSWGSEELRRFGRLIPAASVHVRRAPHDDLPMSPKGFDKVVISGSKTTAMEDAPWIARLHEFIRRTIDIKKPLLGVCYGHQSLVRAISAGKTRGKERVRRAQVSEHGWTLIETLQDSPLTRGLPREFYSFSSHYDEVSLLPSEMKHLARSKNCEIQACQLGEQPVFGIQFHPEKTLQDADRSIVGWQNKKDGPRHIFHAGESKKYYQPEVGETLFRNFFNL